MSLSNYCNLVGFPQLPDLATIDFGPDELEEVTFVKRALTQHLDLDPVVTLGVLCDQIIPSDDPLDEEELAIRDRIRSLVLAFLAGEAKRPLIDRHANCLDSPAEAALVSGLFKVCHR